VNQFLDFNFSLFPTDLEKNTPFAKMISTAKWAFNTVWKYTGQPFWDGTGQHVKDKKSSFGTTTTLYESKFINSETTSLSGISTTSTSITRDPTSTIIHSDSSTILSTTTVETSTIFHTETSSTSSTPTTITTSIDEPTSTITTTSRSTITGGTSATPSPTSFNGSKVKVPLTTTRQIFIGSIVLAFLILN
jgi:hypothetical protein